MTLISRMSSFPILGMLSGIASFYRISCQQQIKDPDQILHKAVSDLGLHCFTFSLTHKKDTRLIWVNMWRNYHASVCFAEHTRL